MTLREQLKEQAGKQLESMICEVVEFTGKLCADSSVKNGELMRVCIGTRNATLKKKIISGLVADMEAQLLKQWDNQLELFEKETKEKL